MVNTSKYSKDTHKSLLVENVLDYNRVDLLRNSQRAGSTC